MAEQDRQALRVVELARTAAGLWQVATDCGEAADRYAVIIVAT